MAYRDPKPAGGSPSIRTLAPSALSADARERLTDRIARRALFRAPDLGGDLGAWAAVLAGLVLFGVAAFPKLGVVESSDDLPALLGAAAYGLGALLAVRGALGLRAGASDLPRGRFILPAGIVEIGARAIRFGSAERLDRFEVRVDPPGPSGLSLVHLVCVFDDGAELETVLFGGRGHVPPGIERALHEARNRLRTARSAGDADTLEQLALLPDEDLPPAAGHRPRSPWVFAAVAGAGITALAYLVALPAVALLEEPTPWGLDAIERAYPFPWVTGRVHTARAALYDAERERLTALVDPALREALADAIAWLAERGETELPVRIEAREPGGAARATEWLEAEAPVGATPAPVTLQRVGMFSRDVEPPGETEIVRALARSLEPRVVEIVSDRWPLGEGPSERPAIVVRYDVVPEQLLIGDGERVFAALGFVFRAQLEVPGRAPAPLGEPFSVAAPTSMSVLRFGDDEHPFDSQGGAADMIGDSMIYNQQLEQASEQYGEHLARSMIPGGAH